MANGLRSFIASIAKSSPPKGPSAAYASPHILKLIMLLDKRESMGRIALSKALEVGEGTVRTMVKKLVESGIIEVDSIGGCTLTERGRYLAAELNGFIVSSSSLDLRSLGIEMPSHALQVRAAISNTSLTKLRDVAVKSGAEGMVIFQYKGGTLAFPMMTDDASAAYPEIAYQIRARFELREGDAILVAFAERAVNAEIGALGAAIYLFSS